jgi:hypothetical protein
MLSSAEASAQCLSSGRSLPKLGMRKTGT